MYVHLTSFTDFKKTMPRLGNKVMKVVTSLSMSLIRLPTNYLT